MKRILVVLLLLSAGDAAAQASPEANRLQEQASAVLAGGQRCPQQIDKAALDRFAARASALIRRADGQPVVRNSSGDYDRISANLVMDARCKNIGCPGHGPPMLPTNCAEFAKIFYGLRINQANWTINEGLK